MQIDFSPAVKALQRIFDSFIGALPNLLVAVLVVALTILISNLTRRFVRRVTDRYGRSPNLGIVLGRISQWTVILTGFLLASVIVFPNFSPAELIQLLGISSVAIGFAFRDILENFLSGIILLLTEPFRINDQIVVGDFEGTVEDIQIRATAIRTYDNRRVVIPNAQVFTNPVIVNTAFQRRRIDFEFTIGTSDDVPAAKAAIVHAISGIKGILESPAPDVIVSELGDYGIVLQARWWIASPRKADALDTRDRVLLAIRDTLLSQGIDLPYPTHQILFHDQTEETDGDRAQQREGWPAGRGPVPTPHNLAGALHSLAARDPSPPDSP